MSLFSAALTEKIKKRLSRADAAPCAILPAIHDIQDEFDYVGPEHMAELARVFQLPLDQIEEVASFYTMIRRTKGARYKITCCDSPSCMMTGAKETLAKLHEHAAKHPEGTFSVEAVPCLGVCGQSPVLLVNKERHHQVTADKVESLMSDYAKRQR
jgi:NADH-quinone oxidoreductase subunit E